MDVLVALVVKITTQDFIAKKLTLKGIIDLFADTAAILISIVSKEIMGCSGGKLICICPLGIP